MQDVFEIAVVLKPQGIKGEVKIKPYCDSPEDFKEFEWVFIKENNKLKKTMVNDVRTDNLFAYLTLEGIGTRNDAEMLRGQTLFVEKSQIDYLPKDLFLIRDLIGMAVKTSEGEKLGELKEIFQHGPVDVYQVKSSLKGFMFPALKRVILKTDIDNNELIIDFEALSEVAVYDD